MTQQEKELTEEEWRAAPKKRYVFRDEAVHLWFRAKVYPTEDTAPMAELTKGLQSLKAVITTMGDTPNPPTYTPKAPAPMLQKKSGFKGAI